MKEEIIENKNSYKKIDSTRKIGVFDSGIGGVTVLCISILYFFARKRKASK